MIQLRFVIACLTLTCIVGTSYAQPLSPESNETAGRPNIVVIMADDLGFGDLSCYGNDRYDTPRLDALAAAGMRFTDFHSNGSVCSPTRAAMLTGRYQQRSGLARVVKAGPKHPTHHFGMQDSEYTFADAMRDAGYATGIVGKWHLGYQPRYNPIHHGFDTYRGYISGNIDFHSHVDEAGRLDWWSQDQIEPETGYVTDLITRHAIDFVRDHKDQPFFLYVAHQSPHYPYQGPDDPPLREVNGKKQKAPKSQIPRAYREMMKSMDTGIGELVEAIEAEGLAERTLVFFVSDNGATKSGNNGGLRGQKGHVFEGGHRVPMIAYWPGRIPAGTVSDGLTLTFDLMPTAIELAQASPPEGLGLDGRSLLTILTGEPSSQGPTDFANRTAFWGQNARWAMREGPWKFVRLRERGEIKEFLFNLDADLSESNNLLNGETERATAMREALDQWIERVQTDATPQPDNPDAS